MLDLASSGTIQAKIFIAHPQVDPHLPAQTTVQNITLLFSQTLENLNGQVALYLRDICGIPDGHATIRVVTLQDRLSIVRELPPPVEGIPLKLNFFVTLI